MRQLSTNIGPTETKQSYAFTSAKRNQHKQKVYSVNIPFSKYTTPTKPGSAKESENPRASGVFNKSFTTSFTTPSQPTTTRNATSFFSHQNSTAKENDAFASEIKQTLTVSSVQMKFPRDNYAENNKAAAFKPNANRKELIEGAPKADFQGQLMASSVKFTCDERNNRVNYNNSAGGGGDRDMIYNLPAEACRKDTAWAEIHDKESKNYLTQMQTLNNNMYAPPRKEPFAALKQNRSGAIKPVPMESRFMTVTDSYFNKGRQSQFDGRGDAQGLKEHYKFHKGTTYSIGKEGQK